MADHIYKRHNKNLLIYHIVCPAKYRRKIFTTEVEKTLKSICLEFRELRQEPKDPILHTTPRTTTNTLRHDGVNTSVSDTSMLCIGVIHLSTKEKWITISWMEPYRTGRTEQEIHEVEAYLKGYLDAGSDSRTLEERVKSYPGLTFKIEEKIK